MHEASLMQSALELAVDQSRQAGASRILCLRLRVGVLSGVVPEALRFAFDSLSAGTAAENADLELITVPAKAWCPHCEATFACDDIAAECPRCDEVSFDLRGGRELELESMEVS